MVPHTVIPVLLFLNFSRLCLLCDFRRYLLIHQSAANSFEHSILDEFYKTSKAAIAAYTIAIFWRVCENLLVDELNGSRGRNLLGWINGVITLFSKLSVGCGLS